jgi:hypothetical protein
MYVVHLIKTFNICACFKEKLHDSVLALVRGVDQWWVGELRIRQERESMEPWRRK